MIHQCLLQKRSYQDIVLTDKEISKLFETLSLAGTKPAMLSLTGSCSDE